MGSADRSALALSREDEVSSSPFRSAAEPGRESVRASGSENGQESTAEQHFITGFVTERSGIPIGSAWCLLRSGTSASGFLVRAAGEEPAVAASTVSSQDGSFRLEAGPGFWKVSVSSPGFAPWERDHLVAGDALVVRLDPEVQLFLSVVGPTGEAVVDAEVIVRAVGEASPESSRCRLRTDTGGHAWVADLAPGSWSLTVRHPEYGIAGVPLEIPVGRFRVEKEVRLERGTRVVGTVRASDGAPIRGALVRIESPYREVFLLEESTSDTNGRYATQSIFSLQETLEVLARAPGHAESTILLGIQPEQARAGEAVVDFVLPEYGRTLSGRAVSSSQDGIRGASIRIAALDPVGGSADDVLVALQGAPPEPWLWQEVALTDGAGRFELSGLSDSPQYVLLLVHDSFAPRMAWVPPAESGSVTQLGDLELLAWGSLFGRTKYADGSPAEGALVSIFKLNRVMVTPEESLERWRPQSWFLPLSTRAKEEGFFRFDSLAPGNYDLLPHGIGSWEIRPGQNIGPVEVVIPEAKPGGRIEVIGLVKDRTGLPISLVFVRAFVLEDSKEERLESTDLVDGNGAFSVHVPADRPSRLSFSDFRGEHVDREVILDPTRRSEPLEVVLDERGIRLPPLEGIVLGPGGEPLEGCDVRLHPPEDGICGCVAFHARTDASGAFRFASVSEGPHRIVASIASFPSKTHYPARPGDYVVIHLEER